tara:strand:- start:1987 stop:2217 length:231 start_codon:yes stop_codon:yes gene_type:complete
VEASAAQSPRWRIFTWTDRSWRRYGVELHGCRGYTLQWHGPEKDEEFDVERHRSYTVHSSTDGTWIIKETAPAVKG